MSDEAEQVDPLIEALQAEYDGLLPTDATNPDEAHVEAYGRMHFRLDAEEAKMDASYKDRKAGIARRRESLIRWMGWNAEAATARLIAGKKAKSFKTFWATTGYRYRSKPKLVYEKAETAQLIDWLYANLPTALRIPTPPSPSIHNESVTKAIAGGMDCPFATVKPPGNDFYLKTNAKETDSADDTPTDSASD